MAWEVVWDEMFHAIRISLVERELEQVAMALSTGHLYEVNGRTRTVQTDADEHRPHRKQL